MKYVKGNLLEAKEPFIAHGCNGQGVMGSGVAAAIRAKWPGAFEVYKQSQLQNGGLPLGSYSAFKTEDGRIVINLVTQEFYGTGKRQVNYASIIAGFDAIAQELIKNLSKDEKVIRIALPKIGAGLGGGDWNLIETLLVELEAMWKGYLEFTVYEI